MSEKFPAPGILSDGAMITLVLICAEAVLLSGCHRDPVGQALTAATAPSAVAAVPLSQLDFGVSVLADVDNARFAIQLRDRIAASNDVDEAIAFARQLTNRPSKLLLSEAPPIEPKDPSSVIGTAVLPTQLTAFGALVKLGSARAELDSDLEAADADLRAIQRGIPSQLIPIGLQLLRAAASLDLARSAVSEGRIPELKTHLLSAELALNTYAGPAHVGEAKALAATIGQTLSQTSTLATFLPNQLSLWLGRVVGWAGSERWSALWPDVTDDHRAELE